MANRETLTVLHIVILSATACSLFMAVCVVAYIHCALIAEDCTVTLTCAAVVDRLCDGFLQVSRPDLLSVPSSLTVLQCRLINHLLSCGAAGVTETTQNLSVPQRVF